MDDPKKKIFKNFDWKSFEQFFGGKLPPLPSGEMDNLNWVEDYVQQVMKQSFPQSGGRGVMSSKYATEVFETHNGVIVKVFIPDKAEAKNIRVLVGTGQVKLEGLPDNKTQSIKLGTAVHSSKCKAVYRNGILQLHLRKLSGDGRQHEADIRFFD